MKTTTTLYELINSEATKEGYNDFYDPDTNQLITNGDRLALINQIVSYTPLVEHVSNAIIFGNFKFHDEAVDNFFKRAFLTRFVNREIKYQTVDVFRNHLVAQMVIDEKWFTDVFNHFDDMFQALNTGANKSKKDASTHTVQDGRSAAATLPQDNTGLDLNNDIVNYADSTNYDKGKTNGSSHEASSASSSGNSFNAEVVEKLNNVFDRKLDEYDAKLFLQIW